MAHNWIILNVENRNRREFFLISDRTSVQYIKYSESKGIQSFKELLKYIIVLLFVKFWRKIVKLCDCIIYIWKYDLFLFE